MLNPARPGRLGLEADGVTSPQPMLIEASESARPRMSKLAFDNDWRVERARVAFGIDWQLWRHVFMTLRQPSDGSSRTWNGAIVRVRPPIVSLLARDPAEIRPTANGFANATISAQLSPEDHHWRTANPDSAGASYI